MEADNLESEDSSSDCLSMAKSLFYVTSSLVGYVLIYMAFTDILSNKMNLLAESKKIPAVKLQVYSVFGILNFIITAALFFITTKTLVISYKKHSAPFYFVAIYGVISFILTVVDILVAINLVI